MAMTLDDPYLDQQAELEKVKSAIVGDMPMMEQPPDGAVQLFRGVFRDQKWHTDAEVSELTGEDEEVIARAMSANDALGFLNAVLLQGTRRLGPTMLSEISNAEKVVLLDNLLAGEKELLFLRILQVTYGDERTVSTVCPSCREDIDVTFSITEDIPIRTLEDPTKLTYDFELKDGSHLEYRLVTGEDEAENAKRKTATTAELNTGTLSRCITSHNGKTIVDPIRFARQMKSLDRRLLIKAINDHQPGPYFKEVKLPCAACGVESSFRPAWADLL